MEKPSLEWVHQEIVNLSQWVWFTVEIRKKCNQILQSFDKEWDSFREQILSPKLLTEYCDIEIKSIWEQIVWEEEIEVDIFLSGKSLKSFASKWLRFLISPMREFSFSKTENVIYIPSSFFEIQNEKNLLFLLILTHELGHSVTQEECIQNSLENQDQANREGYQQVLLAWEQIGIWEKLKWIKKLYFSQKIPFWRSTILKRWMTHSFFWAFDMHKFIFLINALEDLPWRWGQLFHSWKEKTGDAREASFIFTETIAWKRAFWILQNIWVDVSQYPNIVDYAENCLQNYLVRENRFANFGWSKIDAATFLKNMSSWRNGFDITKSQ